MYFIFLYVLELDPSILLLFLPRISRISIPKVRQRAYARGNTHIEGGKRREQPKRPLIASPWVVGKGEKD